MQEFHKTSENIRLSTKQEKAILLLLGNRTIAQVVQEIGVSERSVYNWLKLPHFQERLEEEKSKLREQALDALRGTLTRAVGRLGELIEDESSAISLRACQSVIDYNLNLKGKEEIEERLERLEQQINDTKTR